MDRITRELVRDRALNRCEYCQIPQSGLPWARFQIEHIRARQHGGDDQPGNLALACRSCNLRKGPNLSAIDPESERLVPLFNPRTDSWSQHFIVVDYQVVGLTEIGRATARLLNMNDPDRVQIRMELSSLGED